MKAYFTKFARGLRSLLSEVMAGFGKALGIGVVLLVANLLSGGKMMNAVSGPDPTYAGLFLAAFLGAYLAR